MGGRAFEPASSPGRDKSFWRLFVGEELENVCWFSFRKNWRAVIVELARISRKQVEESDETKTLKQNYNTISQ